MQDAEFLWTGVNDRVGPSETTFVRCSLLQLDALGRFFFYFITFFFLDYSSTMLLLQLLFVKTKKLAAQLIFSQFSYTNQTLPNLTRA